MTKCASDRELLFDLILIESITDEKKAEKNTIPEY